jgi:hypothetical protein
VPDRRAELLAEERRLFYVAVTRARERLVVTAVAGGEGDDRPSRFVEELGVGLPETVTAVGRPLTGAGLVAELRHVAATSADPALREAACRRLAAAAGPASDDVPHVASAHPDRWWGLAPLSDDAPLVGARRDGARVAVEGRGLRHLLAALVPGERASGSPAPPARRRWSGRWCTPWPSSAAAPTRWTRQR